MCESVLFYFPFEAFFRVFYVEAGFVHLVADKVGSSPVFVGFGCLADVE